MPPCHFAIRYGRSLGDSFCFFGLTAFLGLERCTPFLKAESIFPTWAIRLKTFSYAGPPCRWIQDQLVSPGGLPVGRFDKIIHIRHHRL